MSTYPPPPTTTGAPGTSGASGPRAGFGVRLGALIIDGIIVAVVPVILIVVGGASNSNGLIVVGYVLLFVVGITYEIYFIGSRTGQTPGKKMLNIRVVDFNTGGPIGYGRSFIRLIGRYISGIPCYLGYFWMLWDREKQCWHDKMANDVVVPTEYYPVQ